SSFQHPWEHSLVLYSKVVISPSYQHEILQAVMAISMAPHGLIRNIGDMVSRWFYQAGSTGRVDGVLTK
ncbi:MAG: hypothetical protein NZ762_08840, partial [Dehalococcoidia bacterium]|nr:hypothetical protein [Dehalococcoidia bacterium]